MKFILYDPGSLYLFSFSMYSLKTEKSSSPELFICCRNSSVIKRQNDRTCHVERRVLVTDSGALMKQTDL